MANAQARAARSVREVAAALAAGLALVALLTLLAPSVVVLAIGEPVTSLAPIRLSGVHGVEENYGHSMRWTSGRTRLRWPGQFGVQPGAVVVSLAGFPGRQPDQLALQIDGRTTRHAVPEQYGEVRVDLPPGARAPLEIVLTTLTTRPPGESRDLGVRLESVRLENRPLVHRLPAVACAAGVGVLALGACAWLAGIWVAGAGASAARRARGGAVAWLVTAVLTWALAPTVLRGEPASIVPLLVGVAAAWLLARAGHDRVVAAIAGVIVALQATVVVTWCVAAFVDAPRSDIWEMVPMLAHEEAHGLTLADLWAPHNEHRPVVARVAVLANVALSRWNHWNELWLTLGIIAVHVLILVGGVRHAAPSQRLATLVAVTSLVTFLATPTQWENLLQGWQVTLVAGAMGVSGAFLLLGTGAPTWRRLFGAAGLVCLGTAGFGSCLLGWPLGASAILVRRGARWVPRLCVWLAVAAVVVLAYVHGLAPNPGHPPPAPVFQSLDALLRVIYGTCLALAMPIRYVPDVFVSQPRTLDVWLLPALGGAGLVCAALTIVLHLWRSEQRQAQRWVWPALLVVFAAGACAMTAVGRVTFGMHALTASRYIAFSGLFWVGLVLLLTVASPLRGPRTRLAGIVVACVIVGAGMRAWIDSLPYIERHYVGGSLARDALRRGDVIEATALFPAVPVLDQRQQFLERRQLSVFRPGAH